MISKINELVPTIDKLRHILKSISYRFYSTTITFIIASLITQNTKIGFAISSADFFIKIFTYYIHERIWYHIPFGLQRPRKIHTQIKWEPSPENDAHIQVAFLQSEDKNQRNRIKITRSLLKKDSYNDYEYRAIISTYNKKTKERYSGIYIGNKEEIENKFNIKIKEYGK